MDNHDRYEALAGALALGEATDEQRVEFDAHAASCAQCREDSSLGAVRERIASVAAGEIWRPSLAADVRARVHEAKVSRGRRVLTTFAYAIGGSLVLNVLFVTGIAGRALDAVRQAPEFYSQTQRITLEKRARASPAAAPAAIAGDVMRTGTSGAHSLPRAIVTGKSASRPKSGGEVPDVLAGLVIWDPVTRHDVAARFEKRCDETLDRSRDPLSVEPCPAKNPSALGDGQTR